ncbi:MAG: hypothetical protein ABH831_01560 [Candidatus Nealsonbacteria bacterium]
MKNFNFKDSKLLYSVPFALISFELYFGMLFGYFMAHFWSPRIKVNIFKLGRYRLHLHHWILGSIALVSMAILNFSPLPMNFSLGFSGGLVFQGILCYDDWHKILIKNHE